MSEMSRETMSSNRALVGDIDPLIGRDRIHSFEKNQQGHVRERLAGSLAGKHVIRDGDALHLAAISTARADNGTRKASLRNLRSFRLTSGTDHKA